MLLRSVRFKKYTKKKNICHIIRHELLVLYKFIGVEFPCPLEIKKFGTLVREKMYYWQYKVHLIFAK